MGGGEEVVANNEKDTRIVEMQFDAKDFDKGIKQSTKNLEDFKKELNFEDVAKQMTSFSDEVSSIKGAITSMAADIRKLQVEFTGVGKLSNKIAKDIKKAWEGALDSVKRFAKSLTTDQISAGMEKFEKLQTSVQTIKAATGESEEQVYKVLKRLNQYTDQTSYNFSDMAQNIGKFTSVGIPLEKAEKQMEGIANWAARSGGNITEASRAMYNLSQAMGVGALTKIDWKSIENAGMATKEFKNQLIQAGLAVGTLVKKGDKIFTASTFGKQVEVNYKNLAETLSKKWADTETMQKAFEAYYYEDLYYEGKIASAIETSKEQRDEIRSVLSAQDKDAKIEWGDWVSLEKQWKEDGRDVEKSRQALIDAAVEQKKLTKEINEEGYTIYKTTTKTGKQIEITTANLEEFFNKGLADESLITVALNLDADPLIEMTEKQLKALQDALGDDDVILKKDWVETMKDAGLATDAVKKAAIEAGLAVGTLEKKGDKIFTSKKLGKQVEVTMENIEDSFKMKWFNSDVADKVGKFTDLGKAAYEAAQRCTSFKDVLGALKDMVSTGWMNTYTNIFGELTEAMGVFSAICNKASDILSKFIDLRNGILERWGANGGRNSLWGAIIGEAEGLEGDTLFEGAYGLLDAMKDIGDAIYDGFWDFVMRFISDENQAYFADDEDGTKRFEYLAIKLQKITESVREFTTNIKNFLFEADPGETETRFDRIKHVVEAIFSVVTLVVDIVKGVGQFVGNFLTQLYPAFHALELFVDYLLQLFTGSVVKGSKENAIGNFFQRLAEILKPVTSIVNAIVVTIVKVVVYIIEFARQSGLLQVIGAAFKYVLALIANKLTAFINSGIPQMILGWIVEAVKRIPALIARVKGLYDVIANYLKNNEKLKTLISSVKNIFSAGNLKGILKNIKDWVKKLFGSISDLFSGKGGINIGDFFARIFDGLLGLFVGSAGAEDASEALAEAVVEPIADLGTGGQVDKAIEEAKPGILASIKNKVKELWTSFTDAFSSISNSEIVTSIKNKIKEVGAKIGESFTSLTNNGIFDGVKKFFEGTDFMSLLTNAKEFMKWLSIFKAGSGIGQLGKGIKAFGKGFKVFGKNLKNLDLSNIFSNMFNISNIINSNNSDSSVHKSFDFGKIGTQLLQIAASLGILIYSAKMLIDTTKDMKVEEIKQIGIYLGILMGGLLTAGIISKYFVGNGTSLLAIAAALWLIIQPMKALMKIPWKQGDGWSGGLVEMLAKLGTLMLLMVGIAKFAGKIEMKGFVSLAIAINLLIIPIKLLQVMGNDAWNGIVKLGGIMLAMGLLAAVMGTYDFKGFKGMLSLAIAINLLIIPIKAFAKMKWNEAVQGLGAFAAIILGIGLLVKACDGVDMQPLGKMVLAITALSAVGWLIGHTMDWKQALVGFVPIVVLLGMMSLMISRASKIDEAQLTQLAGVFKAFAVTVGVIAGALILMTVTDVSETQLLTFFGGLVFTLGAMGLAVWLSKDVDAAQLQQLKNIVIAFSVIVGLVGGSLVALAQFNVKLKTMGAFFGGLFVLLLGMGVMVKMAGKMDAETVGKLAAVLGVFAGIILVTGGALVAMAHFNVDWKVIAAFTGGLTALIIGLGFALPKLGKLDPKAAVTGILVLAAAIVAIMGAIALMIPVVLGSVGSALEQLAAKLKLMSGLLADFFTRMDTINDSSVEHAMTVFDQIKELVLKFVGFGDHAKDIQSVLDQLEDLGLGLDLFFLNEKDLPDPESSMSFKILNKFIEMSPSFASFSVGNLPNELLYLGVGLGLFNAATKDITSAEPLSLSLLQGIFGQADNIQTFANLPLNQFSGQMSTLGGAMSLYAKGAKEVTGINADADAPDIEQAVGILHSITAALSGEDGKAAFEIPENIPSEDDLGVFAAQLGALGLAMSSFSEGAKGMDDSGVQKAIDAITLFAVIGGYLTPDSLAFTGAFDDAEIHAGEGTGTLGQFALDIGALGTALGEFSSLTSNASFGNGLGALDHFQEINEKLTKDNLMFAFVFKNANIHASALDIFAEDIGHLGRALKSFAENVMMDDGTQADFDHAIKALNFMVTLQHRMPDVGGLQELIHGHKKTFDDLGTEMEGLGQGMSDFSKKITGEGQNGTKVDFEAVKTSLDIITAMVNLISTMSVKNPDTGAIYGIGYFVEDLKEFMSGLVSDSGSLTAFLHGTEDMPSVAESIALFAKGVSDAFSEAGDINTGALAGFANIAQGLHDLSTIDPSLNFEYPGQMIALGIATGISNGESEVVNAAIAVVQAAIDAANETADSHSPSRVFQQLGEYMDMGLANGLYGEQDTVEGASEDMTNSVIQKAGLIMGAVSQALADNVDLQPTITPVLDLTNLTSAGSMLDSIFDGYALNLTSALNRAAASTTVSGPAEVIVQNPVDVSGIQNSIYTLQTDINNLHTAISNIKIVLNTGVLAGGLTDDIDLNLGRQGLYAGRRN